jgi:hypothetical protein
MKSEQRVIGKNGVQCFLKHWFYFEESMSEFKGRSVEIRYSDDDYSKVFVVLPNGRMCEAQRINPTSLLNPDKETVKRIRKAKANERRLTNEFELLNHSRLRGETAEDRIALEVDALQEQEEEGSYEVVGPSQGQVHQLTRLDYVRHKQEPRGAAVTSSMVAQSPADTSIFADIPVRRIKDFDYDE